ncbi:MAG: PASTA domain-containing protein, partial [Gammaproteobacteria bacterium]
MKTPRIVNFIAGLAMGITTMTPVQALTHFERHTFSIDDLQGDFAGNTYGGTTTTDGTIPPDRTILCDEPSSTVNCPPDISPMTDTKLYGQQNPIILYPIDSEFGYEVIDFLGAAQKTRDGDYLEGFIGNVPPANFPPSADIDGVTILFNDANPLDKYPPIQGGVAVSNAATDTYKVKAPMGTWCRGLGGLSVKCETEHYSVMEHILTCHELIPYFYADPVSGTQAVLNPGSVDIPTLPSFDCADAGLDDIALILVGGVLGPQLVDGTPCEAVNDPVGCQMFPNDKTDTQNNVALTSDYSVQLKDDGKALYGWGTIHKRPNDVRLYASLPLPAEWKVPGANYIINKAKLVIRHHITNNPNDQIRPEDLENEAATGRKPSYTIQNAGLATETWKSTKACFEGDGDLIDNEEGTIDPTFIGVGTVFKNTFFAITTSPPTSTVPTNDTDLPYPLSSDLREALTNAWYTTVDRDPFEWSYDMNADPTIQDFQGSWLEDPNLAATGTLVSGPRWRLRPNKYGQDLPGLEVAIEPAPGQGTDGADCYAPPFESALIKYPVGDPTITEIDLLDWIDASTSPLAYSRGWIDVTQNGAVTVAGTNNNVPYTTNGLPMSDDFDLAIYIKGDRKPTAVYDAYLEIDFDVAQAILDVPNVVGLTQAAAEAAILAANLTVGTVTFSSSATVPAGDVISQNPAACVACATFGDPVDLVVSTGPAVVLIDVPDVVGLTQAAAEAAILAANLT